jgi:hypothetical protein
LKFLLVAKEENTKLKSKELLMTNANLFVELSQKEEAIVSGGTGTINSASSASSTSKNASKNVDVGPFKQIISGSQYSSEGGSIHGSTGAVNVGNIK